MFLSTLCGLQWGCSETEILWGTNKQGRIKNDFVRLTILITWSDPWVHPCLLFPLSQHSWFSAHCFPSFVFHTLSLICDSCTLSQRRLFSLILVQALFSQDHNLEKKSVLILIELEKTVENAALVIYRMCCCCCCCCSENLVPDNLDKT